MKSKSLSLRWSWSTEGDKVMTNNVQIALLELYREGSTGNEADRRHKLDAQGWFPEKSSTWVDWEGKYR